jgi:Ca2+-binding RTX toxin-like protein
MSIIRYTLNGDYDPGESQKLDTSFPGSPLDGIAPYRRDMFIITSGRRDEIVDELSVSRDGIYADFSDNPHSSQIVGGERGDILIAGVGDDVIRGNLGDDVIVAGAGVDRVDGGAGADRIVFQTMNDFAIGRPDRIVAFSGAGAEGDQIDLTAIAAFAFIGTARFNGDGAPEVRARAFDGIGSGYLVIGDMDGNGDADFKFKVNTDRPLTQADFTPEPPDLTSPTRTITDGRHPAFAEPLLAWELLALA